MSATLVAAGLCVGLGGCVTQQEYDKLWETNRALQDRNNELLAQVEDCRSTVTAYQTSAGGADQAITDLRSTNSRLREQLAQANGAIEQLEDELNSMEIGQLDPQTDRALRRLAAAHPKLIRYDADRGVLQFASDLTFASGSAEVREGAKQSIAALADVLSTPEAGEYDIRVVGHTDSAKISAGTAQRHPTNMHLSVHRAISVRAELVGLGVDEAKVEAAGWGEFRPLVANTETGDTPQNRRVEIYLVRSLIGGASASAAAPTNRSASVDDETVPAQPFEPTK